MLIVLFMALHLPGIGSHHGSITGIDPGLNVTAWQQSIFVPWSTSTVDTGTPPPIELTIVDVSSLASPNATESRAPFPEVLSCPKISKDHGYTLFLGSTTSPVSITTPPAHLESFYGVCCFVYPDPETVFTTNIVALGGGMWMCECNMGEVPLRNKTKKFTCGMLEECCA